MPALNWGIFKMNGQNVLHFVMIESENCLFFSCETELENKNKKKIIEMYPMMRTGGQENFDHRH